MLRTVSKLKIEADMIGIQDFKEYKNENFWDRFSYIENISIEDKWKTLQQNSFFHIKSYSQSKYCSEYPIIKISIYLSKTQPLASILNSIFNFENRKKWDSNIELLESIKINDDHSVIHTIFQYSFYRPEIFEQQIIGTLNDTVIIGLYSYNGNFKYSEGTIPLTTYFSLYFIREFEGKTQINVFLHFNANSAFTLNFKKLAYKRIEIWAESFRNHLESLKH